jgi:hypothetical protein
MQSGSHQSTVHTWQAGRALWPLLCLALLPSAALAQWFHYPTPGLTRTADGTPNLAAPAPRTAQGKPDFTGIWDYEKNRPCPAAGCFDLPVGKEFIDLSLVVPGGLPFTPWARALVAERKAKNGAEDTHSTCLPSGPIRTHTIPMLRKIVQLPALLLILSERNTSFRQIFLDGRPLPVDPQPSWNGYSVGAWEGDTLVVQTIGLRDGIWLDAAGSPLTEAAKLTERYRRPSQGTLEIQITVDDPKAYTKPWTITLKSDLTPDTELLDYTCLENEHSVEHFKN